MSHLINLVFFETLLKKKWFSWLHLDLFYYKDNENDKVMEI